MQCNSGPTINIIFIFCIHEINSSMYAYNYSCIVCTVVIYVYKHNDQQRVWLACFLLLVSCSSLASPSNGVITCSLGGDGVANPVDTCSFSCNTGYKLTGGVMRTCQNNGSWNGSDSMCSRGEYIAYWS